MNTIITKKFKIDGMHCSACAMNIDFELEDLKGVTKAHTNYAKQESDIEFDTNLVSIDQIVDQIKKTGYSASVVKE